MKYLEERIKGKKEENEKYQVLINEKSFLSDIISIIFFSFIIIGVIILSIVLKKELIEVESFIQTIIFTAIIIFIIFGTIIGLLNELDVLIYRIQARKGQENDENKLKIRVILDIIKEVLGYSLFIGVLVLIVIIVISSKIK